MFMHWLHILIIYFPCIDCFLTTSAIPHPLRPTQTRISAPRQCSSGADAARSTTTR